MFIKMQMRMSGCRMNMFVMPIQVFIVFTGASYSFEML